MKFNIFNKRSQVIVVGLWILTILSLLVVIIGHQVSISLRLSRYHIDKLKSRNFAIMGINIAINELLIDNNDYDGFDENWSDNEKLFKNLVNKFDSEGYASINYLNDDNTASVVYGLKDEEGKININTVTPEMFSSLLDSIDETNEELGVNIIIWRNNNNKPIDWLKTNKENTKPGRFIIPEELILIEGVDNDLLIKIYNFITVWGDGRININTAPELVINSLVKYCQEYISDKENFPQDLTQLIMDVRPVSSFEDLVNNINKKKDLSSDQLNILNDMENLIDFKSSNYRISSKGVLIKGNITTEINCVFNREKKQILYWHEN